MQETWVQSLGWEDPLENKRVTHSSISKEISYPWDWPDYIRDLFGSDDKWNVDLSLFHSAQQYYLWLFTQIPSV